MKLSTIVFALRMGKTSFESRYGGAIEFAVIQTNTLQNEVGYVIPLGDDATDNDCDNSINQKITERFGVVCALKNNTSPEDKTGILAYDRVHNLRADLIRVLVNLDLGYDSPIEYASYKILDMDRAWLWIQFEFKFRSRIMAEDDGIAYIEERDVDDRQDPAQLPGLNTIYTEYILTPSKYIPYTGQLPAETYGVEINTAQQVDLDDDPNPGGFDSGFSRGFRILLEGILRRE